MKILSIHFVVVTNELELLQLRKLINSFTVVFLKTKSNFDLSLRRLERNKITAFKDFSFEGSSCGKSSFIRVMFVNLYRPGTLHLGIY